MPHLRISEAGKDMAAKLLIDDLRDVVATPAQPLRGSGPRKSMNRESQVRFVAVLLFLITVAAVVFAGFNFDAELKASIPDDGVWWVEHGGRLTADRVDPAGPGAKSGIKSGDRLVAVDRADLSWYRPVCALETLDGSWLDALLYFLPGLVHCVLLQIHREAERLRLDHLLGQHRRRSIAAGAVSALRFDLPRETPGRAQVSVAVGAGLRTGRDPAGDSCGRHALAAGQ